MAATTTLLGLVTPTQGTLTGTWGDTVNYGISDYLDIAIAGTLSFAGDGAITLANTTGSSSGNSIGATTAQYAIIRVTGTLTTAKIITGPSYSKTYLVVNAATGSTVTFKASGQTGVSIAVGETALVYYNGTDYVKVVGTATAGAAGGSNTQVQYNNSGVLAGITGATTNGTALTLVAPVLGTPASGTVTNLTGTASININGTVGATTANTGAFTTLSATGGNGNQLALDNTGQRFTQIDLKNNGTAKGRVFYDNTNLVNSVQAITGSTVALQIDEIQIATASSTGLAVTGTLSATTTGKVGTTLGVGDATPAASGAGITFPATQSASTNANTLDDYEEGTWTPTQGAGVTVIGTFESQGVYTKIGRTVVLRGQVSGSTSIAVTGNTALFGGLPFTAPDTYSTGSATNGNMTTAGSILLAGVIGYSTSFAATTFIYFTVTYQV